MKKPFPARTKKRLEGYQARDQQTDQAILARLDNIEALLKRLLEKQTAEIPQSNATVEEEINMVIAQGIDPAAYLKARYQKQREAQS